MSKSTSEKHADAHSAKVQAAVEKAWHAEQPKELLSVQFGRDHVGHGYRVWVGPVVRDLAKALGCDAKPSGFGDLRQQVADWQPTHTDWARVKGLLLVGVDELSDAMSTMGADELDNDFFVKAPDLIQRRAKDRELAGTK